MDQVANDDTELHDALRRHGILPPKPEPIVEEEVVLSLNEMEKAKASGDSDESPTDPDVEQFLDEYCKSRRADLMAAGAERYKVSGIKEVTRSSYVKDVAEASRVKPVLILLYNQGKDSKMVEAALSEVEEEFYGRLSVCKIEAKECISNYPDRNVPTLILYAEGSAKKNFVGMGQIHTSYKLSCAQNIIDNLKTILAI